MLCFSSSIVANGSPHNCSIVVPVNILNKMFLIVLCEVVDVKVAAAQTQRPCTPLIKPNAIQQGS